jgi:hypothetical protein
MNRRSFVYLTSKRGGGGGDDDAATALSRKVWPERSLRRSGDRVVREATLEPESVLLETELGE